MTDFLYRSSPWMLPTLMFVVLGLAIELPYRFKALLPLKKLNPDSINAVQTALLTLSAFVLGLSFSQASARFDARRSVVVAEANSIDATWLRADQLQPAESKRFRRILTGDTAAGLVAYQSPYDPELVRRTTDRINRDEKELWRITSSALRSRETLGLSLLMQSLNDTLDFTARERQALASHVPTAIVVLTLCLVTLATLSLGIRFAVLGSRPVMMSIIYVVAYVIVIEMMVDYDRPNNGFVTVSLSALTDELQSMQHSP